MMNSHDGTPEMLRAKILRTPLISNVWEYVWDVFTFIFLYIINLCEWAMVILCIKCIRMHRKSDITKSCWIRGSAQ